MQLICFVLCLCLCSIQVFSYPVSLYIYIYYVCYVTFIVVIVCLFACLLVCLFVCLFACLFVSPCCLFVCLFVCLLWFALLCFALFVFRVSSWAKVYLLNKYNNIDKLNKLNKLNAWPSALCLCRFAIAVAAVYPSRPRCLAAAAVLWFLLLLVHRNLYKPLTQQNNKYI